ncbi:microtubule-associated proteins 1A/1B light chain 3A-like [Panonychus citri]|uniref:microtubule-associated proteins 1A/1B light chain 3A-like n=1 Tax=Panonychus citri TaxID=50023 RepID=UPI0023076707|nr:microtubule-associated proteins 1A/1B light chain 3A-like [Panonychus citri]
MDKQNFEFKRNLTFDERQKQSQSMRRLYSDKTPIIIEKYRSEKQLPIIDRNRYLVPQHLPCSKLVEIVRRRLTLHPSYALFLLAGGKSLVSNSKSVGQVAEQFRDPDGFLYIVYASQETFG